MRYAISDLHGEYDMFLRLLEKIKFSPSDEMYICGDIIDKGRESIKLLKFIFEQANMYPIMGNHEHSFLMFYRSVISKTADNFDMALRNMQEHFSYDSVRLDFDTIDRMQTLPYYIERDEFICVHAGIPINKDRTLPPLSSVAETILINDRHFKSREAVHTSDKCVFFGHTQTNTVCSEPRILPYLRENKSAPYNISDFYKVHLDTGTWSLGVMGCFAIDKPAVYYVRK